MKRISDDDKEFLAIMAAIICMVISVIVCIYTGTKVRTTPQKRYEETCITNYLKTPFKECFYKEVK